MATLKSKGCKLIHSINDKAFDTALLDRGTSRRVQFVLAAYVFEENSVIFCLFCTLSHTYCVIPSRSMSYYFKQRFMLIKNNYTHLLQISKCISNDKSYFWPLKLQILHTFRCTCISNPFDLLLVSTKIGGWFNKSFEAEISIFHGHCRFFLLCHQIYVSACSINLYHK